MGSGSSELGASFDGQTDGSDAGDRALAGDDRSRCGAREGRKLGEPLPIVANTVRESVLPSRIRLNLWD